LNLESNNLPFSSLEHLPEKDINEKAIKPYEPFRTVADMCEYVIKLWRKCRVARKAQTASKTKKASEVARLAKEHQIAWSKGIRAEIDARREGVEADERAAENAEEVAAAEVRAESARRMKRYNDADKKEEKDAVNAATQNSIESERRRMDETSALASDPPSSSEGVASSEPASEAETEISDQDSIRSDQSHRIPVSLNQYCLYIFITHISISTLDHAGWQVSQIVKKEHLVRALAPAPSGCSSKSQFYLIFNDPFVHNSLCIHVTEPRVTNYNQTLFF
jgi:hypothetical protein